MIVERLEYIISKLGHPSPVFNIANLLLENQNITGFDRAEIGRNCIIRGDVTIGEGVVIKSGCEIRIDVDIGKGTKIGSECELFGDINVGKYCAIARDVTFQQLNHPIDRPATSRTFYHKMLDSELGHVSSGPINIGNDVWIGTGVIILSGVTVGDGAVIGAGSVVTHDVEPYAVVGGAPAEQIRWRFPEEVRERLLDISWWEWDESQIQENNEFFHTKVNSIEDLEMSLTNE